ncbi:MAG: C39 family peptidase [Pelolinea sp.]|nr:C39 family peptidase [Pelolinea sp.]
MRKRFFIIVTLLSVATIISYALILSPTFQEKIGWRLNSWIIRARVWLNPPQEVVFSSEPIGTPDPDALPSPNVDSEQTGEDAPIEILRPTATFAPIPETFELVRGEYFSQHNRWNYCGPANIAMQLSMWGWEGTHDDAARAIKPYKLDKNVMPYEMAAFADQQPGLGALVRVGGNLDTLKRLIAAGYPVVVEKGPQFRDISFHITWMGHYQLFNGYNDREEFFIAQDSYIQADYEQPYETLISEWRSFNYTYLVVFPETQKNDVLNLIGDNADVNQNYKNALKKAQDEIYQLTDVDRFFAIFNYGTNLVNLRDYEGAADAYDQAFALYDDLPEGISVPYRILWYQTGPFFAYYYTGRYTDVIKLATENSIEMVRDDEPALEESYYWRGMAKIAVGDKQGGVEDFSTCLEYHPGFDSCIEELNKQGVYP